MEHTNTARKITAFAAVTETTMSRRSRKRRCICGEIYADSRCPVHYPNGVR